MKKWPTITMHRPWCFWVMQGWKTIETRTHNRFERLYGRTIAIHEGKTIDLSWREHAQKYLTNEQIVETVEYLNKNRTGHVMCFVCVCDYKELDESHEKQALIECKTKRYGLFLKDIAIITGMKAKGHQGIWYLEYPIGSQE